MKWVKVESSNYYTQNKVKLNYKSILQLHRVRCVRIDPNAPPEVHWSKFGPPDSPAGQCEVTEYWQTKDAVESKEAHWEVELKPGEY
jgi:hypothetical protein